MSILFPFSTRQLGDHAMGVRIARPASQPARTGPRGRWWWWWCALWHCHCQWCAGQCQIRVGVRYVRATALSSSRLFVFVPPSLSLSHTLFEMHLPTIAYHPLSSNTALSTDSLEVFRPDPKYASHPIMPKTPSIAHPTSSQPSSSSFDTSTD